MTRLTPRTTRTEQLFPYTTLFRSKPPGAARSEVGYHQDIRFRLPRDAYRNPAASYVQTGIAIDPHRPENGAMTVYPGSHRLGEVEIHGVGSVMDRPMSGTDLRRAGLDPAEAEIGRAHV